MKRILHFFPNEIQKRRTFLCVLKIHKITQRLLSCHLKGDFYIKSSITELYASEEYEHWWKILKILTFGSSSWCCWLTLFTPSIASDLQKTSKLSQQAFSWNFFSLLKCVNQNSNKTQKSVFRWFRQKIYLRTGEKK